MSGLIDQCIGIFYGRPQSRRTLQGPGEDRLASASGLAEGFFLLDTSNGVADLPQSVLEFEARGIQWRTPIIGQRASYRQTVAPDRFGLWIATLFQGSLERPHSSHEFLQLRFGMSIGFVERIDGIFEVMKLTELMGHLREDKGHRAADGFLPIGDHAFDRHLQLL